MAEHELPNACATLKDLCARDKTKVSKLIKQVVELKHERTDLQQALHAAQTMQQSLKEKVDGSMECNKDLVRENSSMKAKLVNAVTLLRIYQHKVQVLEAHAAHMLTMHQPPVPTQQPAAAGTPAMSVCSDHVQGQQMLAMEGGQRSTLSTHMQAHITVDTNLSAAQSMAVSTSATTGHGLPSPGQASTSGQGEAAQLRATMPAADDSLSECSLLTEITSDTTSVLSLSPHSPKEATPAAASPVREQAPTQQRQECSSSSSRSSTQSELLALAQVLDAIAKSSAPAAAPPGSASRHAAGSSCSSPRVAAAQPQAATHGHLRRFSTCIPEEPELDVVHGELRGPTARKLHLHPGISCAQKSPTIDTECTPGCDVAGQKPNERHPARAPDAAASLQSNFTDCLAELIDEAEHLQRLPWSGWSQGRPHMAFRCGSGLHITHQAHDDTRLPLKDRELWSDLELVEENDLLASIIDQEGSNHLW